jgi:hypothetical protein
MANMMHQDTEMSEILQSASMLDAMKQKLYNANMENYLSLRCQIPTVQLASDTEQEPQPKEKAWLSDADVVEHVGNAAFYHPVKCCSRVFQNIPYKSRVAK